MQNPQGQTTESLSHGDFKRFSQCLRVSVVQKQAQELLDLIVNLQYVAFPLFSCVDSTHKRKVNFPGTCSQGKCTGLSFRLFIDRMPLP